MYIVQFPL